MCNRKIVFAVVVCMLTTVYAVAQQAHVKPKWASDATNEQKAIISEIIRNMVVVKGSTTHIGNSVHKEANKNTYDQYRQVTLSDYLINKYEVRQREYDIIMRAKGGKEVVATDAPLIGQCWYNCYRFIDELNRLSGLKFRMPTEAEWEYAAMGGGKTKGYCYAGSDDYAQVGWLKPNSGDSIHEVGKLSPNELGLYDMTGNVFEFVLDNYEAHPSSVKMPNPLFLDNGVMRTVKGAWAGSAPEDAKIHIRFGINAGFGFSNIGMRLALGGGIANQKIVYPKPPVKLGPNEIDTTLIRGVADSEKTQFMKGEEWDKLLAEAQRRQRPIFLDCYTQWCKPCKSMAKYVFPTRMVGNYLNERFINATLDMETPKGRELNKQLRVGAYPTFLILTPEGNVLERFGGMHNARNTIHICDSLLSLHPKYDFSLSRYPEPKAIDSTDYTPGRETKVFKVSLEEAIRTARAAGKKIVMLDCSTAWCGHCRIVEKYIFPLASVGDLLNKDCIVNYMDMDGEEGKVLGKKFGITAYPVFLFLDLEGKEIGRVNGGGSAKSLKRRWGLAMKGIEP